MMNIYQDSDLQKEIYEHMSRFTGSGSRNVDEYVGIFDEIFESCSQAIYYYDIGCGVAFLSKFVDHYHGVDINCYLVNQLRKKRISATCLSALDYEYDVFPNRKSLVFFGFEFLNSFSFDQVLELIRNFTKRGGRYIAIDLIERKEFLSRHVLGEVGTILDGKVNYEIYEINDNVINCKFKFNENVFFQKTYFHSGKDIADKLNLKLISVKTYKRSELFIYEKI